MVQHVVIVFCVIVGQRVAADDQLQSVSGLRDQRHGQAAVKVPRPDMVHLSRGTQSVSTSVNASGFTMTRLHDHFTKGSCLFSSEANKNYVVEALIFSAYHVLLLG